MMTQKEQDEKAKKQYANAEVAGLARIAPIAPIDKTPAQPVQQPKSFFQQFTEMTTPPISAEEQAKRERAAKAVQGIGALGNMITAFSNLTYTGEGAPSQTLPTQSVDNMGKEMTSWQDKLKSEREKYQKAGLDAIARDYEIAYRADQAKQQQANADRAYELQKSQAEQQQKNWETTNKQQQARYAKADEQWQKTHNLAKQREDRLYQEESKKNKPVPFSLSGSYVSHYWVSTS